MDPKDLLDKISAKERDFRKREFLAPYTHGMRTAIVKMDKVNYRFRIVGFQGSGIGIFQPVDHSCARFKKDADIEQTRAYLDILPHLHVILAYDTDQGWVAYPYNMESTQKRFALRGEVIVKNVTDAERFDVITTRFDGMQFWFDEHFASADAIKAEQMREALNPSLSSKDMKKQLQKIKSLTPEDERAFDLAIMSWNHFKKVTTESKIEELLAVGGGKLGAYVIRGANIEIKWKSKSGEEYMSTVNKDSFDVVCAGICLEGEDEKFHLKDLPFVIEEGERANLIYRTYRNVDFEGLDEDL